jgi:hypothetical protein
VSFHCAEKGFEGDNRALSNGGGPSKQGSFDIGPQLTFEDAQELGTTGAESHLSPHPASGDTAFCRLADQLDFANPRQRRHFVHLFLSCLINPAIQRLRAGAPVDGQVMDIFHTFPCFCAQAGPRQNFSATTEFITTKCYDQMKRITTEPIEARAHSIRLLGLLSASPTPPVPSHRQFAVVRPSTACQAQPNPARQPRKPT